MRRFIKGILKQSKPIHIYIPNNVRLSFYIAPLGDVSNKVEFTTNDLESITLLDQSYVNPDLFEQPNYDVDGNILALLDEGVLKGVKTGADLGLFDYQPIVKDNSIIDYSKYISNEFVQRIDEPPTIDKSFLDYEEDYNFSHCILAENDPLGDASTKIIRTFRGYLEVTTGEFSFIRNCTCDDEVSTVYIPKEYIYKYQLRHGDEIVCTCHESKGMMLLDSLLTINQYSIYMWDVNRPWFNNLKPCKSKMLKCMGEYSKTIINKFGLLEGDSVFMYLNKSTQKNQLLTKFMQELSGMFDKIVYINPKYKSSIILGEGYNIVKFCAPINAKHNHQATVALLGSQHARRLMEMGKRVAIIIDDVEAIISLDKPYAPEMPISKTIFSANKVCDNGSYTSFTLIPLRTLDIHSFDIPNEIKCAETLGIMVDYNEIDLFNSYRI